MKYIKEWLKKREVIHDFKETVRLLKAQLAEVTRRQAEIPPDVFDVMRFVLEENIDFYKSIISLYKTGQFQSCLLIGRTIIENSINLQYILREDTERRAKNFILHSATSTLEGLKNLKEEIRGKAEVIKHIEGLKEQIQKSGSRNFSWDGKSFKQICDELGLGEIYNAWYSRLSKFVHPHYKNTRDLEQERPFNNFLKRLISKDMLVLTLQSLKDINKRYKLLEGGAIISDYPEEGALMVFSISSDEADEEAANYMANMKKNKN